MPLVMGILNLTPDSFSDGGKYNALDSAYAQALKMIEQGADVIDIGAESSRPGARAVSIAEETERIRPILKKIRQESDICISIDTYKPEVMKVALDLGVDIINDIFALKQKAAVEIVKQYDVPICLMHQNEQHLKKKSSSWQEDDDVWPTMLEFFEERLGFLEESGLVRERLILDPGFGFGKVCQDNLKLINRIDKLAIFGLPILIGASRKTFIGKVLDKTIDERIFGGCAITAYTFMHGVNIHRTHDVLATKDTLLMLKAILEQDMNND
jgi:dihydropteroate synthase